MFYDDDDPSPPHLPPSTYNYATIEAANNTSKNYSLSTISMNVQSYKSNYLHILNLISSLNDPCVLSMCEIWSPPDNILRISNYHKPIVKKRQNRRGGGVSLHIRSDLKIIKANLLQDLNFRCLELVSALVETNNDKRVVFITLYRAPSKNIFDTLEELETLFEHLSNTQYTYIIQGDTNIDYYSKSLISLRYLHLLNSYGLTQLVHIPTRVTSTSKTVIDHVITNKRNEIKLLVLENNFSDHQPVFLNLFELPAQQPPPTNDETDTPEFLNYKKTVTALEKINWENVEKELINLSSNDATKRYIEVVQSCMKYERFQNKDKMPMKPWMTGEILKVRQKQLRKRRIFLKDPTEAKEKSYKKAKAEYKKALKKSRNIYYHQQILKADNNSKKIWTIINEATNRKIREKSTKIKIKKNDQLITNDYEVAACFNDFYINFGPDLAKTIPKADKPVEDLLKHLEQPNDEFSFRDMTQEEIEDIISSLKPKTSSSADRIPNKLLLAIKSYVSKILTSVINKSFKEGQFPPTLKIAKLIPLFKSSDPLQCTNYRPISNLSCISKVFEKAAQSQIATYTTKNHIIPDLQFGFRPRHSTMHALMAITEHIQKQLNNNKHVFVCSLDLKKAFDLVQTATILPLKLKHLKFNENSIDWITSFFKNRTQYVNVNGVNSTTENLKDISVCQGSSMGPPTFSLFIYDLPQQTGFDTFMFADDTTLLLAHNSLKTLIKKANRELVKIQNYMTANQMFLNLQKTVYTLYHPQSKNINQPPPTVKVGEHPISMVQDFKFLGVNLQNDRKFKIQYNAVIEKMHKGLAALYIVKYDFPSKIKLMIFNALVKSAYEYATPIWSLQLKQKDINYILKLQKRALRVIYKIRGRCHSYELFKLSGVVRFDFMFPKYVIELLFKFFVKDLPTKIIELLDHFSFPRTLRKCEKHIFNIPMYLKPGDLFYEIMSCWNKTPLYVRQEIYEESQKEKPSFLSIKKLSKKYVETLYPICNKKSCYLCVKTKLFMAIRNHRNW